MHADDGDDASPGSLSAGLHDLVCCSAAFLLSISFGDGAPVKGRLQAFSRKYPMVVDQPVWLELILDGRNCAY